MKLNENNSRKFDRAVTALIFMGFLFIGACCLCSCEKPEDNLINQHYEKIEEQKESTHARL